MIYLALGFYIATLSFVKDGISRNLNNPAALFPSPVTMSYNTHVKTLSGFDSAADFMNAYFTSPPFAPVPLTKSFQADNFEFEMNAYATALLENPETHGFGSYYLTNIDKTNNYYEVVIMPNMTSQTATAAFSNFMIQNILRQATGKADLTFNTYNQPLPYTQDDKKI